MDDILELLSEYGPVPDILVSEVRSQGELSVLKLWLKLAARAGSMEDFLEQKCTAI